MADDPQPVDNPPAPEAPAEGRRDVFGPPKADFTIDTVSTMTTHLEFAWQKGAFLGQPLEAQFSVLSNLILSQRRLSEISGLLDNS